MSVNHNRKKEHKKETLIHQFSRENASNVESLGIKSGKAKIIHLISQINNMKKMMNSIIGLFSTMDHKNLANMDYYAKVRTRFYST